MISAATFTRELTTREEETAVEILLSIAKVRLRIGKQNYHMHRSEGTHRLGTSVSSKIADGMPVERTILKLTRDHFQARFTIS